MSDTSPQELREQRMPVYRKIVRTLWLLLGLGFLGAVLTFFLLSFSDLPDTEELENPKSVLASEVIAVDGTVLGRYFIENRVPIEFNQLSPYVEQALVATEDERYYDHSGIDYRGLARAVVKTGIMGDDSGGGASTITQQLAKLLFTDKKASNKFERIIQKLKEWIIAIRLEKKYTKEEIIAMYLNKFDFLYDSYGIKAASETYFATTQDSLKIEEAAMLVGMLKNPAVFNPKRNEELAFRRRMVVLNQMMKNELLTQTEYDSLKNLPLDISNFSRKTHTKGLAQYFRSELAQTLNNDILKSDLARKKSDGSAYNVWKDGLKIYTTIDPIFQKHAEEAMVEHMAELQERFWKVWERRGISPWEYEDNETTPAELRYRKRKLQSLIRNSERYQKMRHRKLYQTLVELENEVDGLRLTDNAIEWMIADEYPKQVTNEQKVRYRKAMKSKNWNQLKGAWAELNKEVEKVFNEKTEMSVFAYTPSGEKDTIMTPLDSLKYHHMHMQIGSLAVDPRTGHVKAWIGGINHKHFAYDHTTSNRQVGSTFKPFIYATAIGQQRTSPCYEITDLPRTIFPGDGNFGLLEAWTPSNSNGKYSGEKMTLRVALKKSVNTASVFLMQQLGTVTPVIDLLEKMGVDKDKIPAQPSICLGAADLSVFDMVGAYTTFANNGSSTKPIFVTRIEDKNGLTIYSDETKHQRALDEEANFVMLEMLKYAASTSMGGIKSQVGGKTGTTNDYVDGWFMGVTPNLVVGTWVGGEDRWIRFLTLRDGQGGRMARPFFKSFLKRLEADEEADYNVNARFHRPRGDLSIGLDCDDLRNRGGEDDEYEDDAPQEESIEENPFGEG